MLGEHIAFFERVHKVFYFYGSTVLSLRCSEPKRFKRVSSIEPTTDTDSSQKKRQT